ncbi:MAG: sulfatase-like hydrolase/transferase [Dehalococcoidia bacterium]|nr:sulfatase-like hydrolase/transferase [Dehalococcoidia bacterium]
MEAESAAAPSRPKNAVVILLDSLNRHMLGSYGGKEFATPNLDAFAAGAIQFEKHYAGSLPCMPARHDILCGALDFLWRPWGSIEIWEDAITRHLHKAGVVSQLISDHPHLFEMGGENYHADFSAWDYQRGHEGDLWKTRPDTTWMGAPGFGRPWQPYDNSRGYFREESDFPGPKTMAAAAKWVDENAGYHDRFFLFIDEFDPHEPFDTPEPYAKLYDDTWEGPHLIWPPYHAAAQRKGILTERQAFQVRSQYGGKLTMIDHWFGKVMESLERNGVLEDTAVIVCTDHGHYLGERDIWGKPAVPVYEPLGHIPLMIRWPGIEPSVSNALTTSVDIFATLCDLFGIEPEHRTHGKSLIPLVTGAAKSVREWALLGVWGREVHLVDDEAKYARAPENGNFPISMWSNRWSTMPVHIPNPPPNLPRPDERAFLDRMPGTRVPVIRQPFQPGDMLPHWASTRFTGNYLYRPGQDPDEEENLVGRSLEREMADKLRQALLSIEAPDDTFIRFGLS